MSETEKIVITEEFKKIIRDFVGDIKTTFPEYNPLISKWWKDNSSFVHIEKEDDRVFAYENAEDKSCKDIFAFCQKKLPPRFFDILYQNEEIFKEDSQYDTEFLPNIHFKNLWNLDISKKTRETIWKYLQLILFSIVGSLDNKEAFGDSAKLFEAINEDEFKQKLEESLSQMQSLFENMNLPTGDNGETNESSNGGGEGGTFNMEGMPNADDIHNHITSMLDGKLGQLAKEIAEETANDLNMDMDNVTDMKGVFNNLIKNPTKLMGLVKNVGNKLDSKIKSGEIKESELISEATEMMNKMKNMPGMGDIQSILSKMGLNGLGGKLNTNAMQSQLNKNMKSAQNKERMRAKAEASRLAKEKQSEKEPSSTLNTPLVSEEEIIKIFSTGETVERTPRTAKPNNQNNDGKKKKKNKK
uniref:Uncharacterized protein n=1 Tax=viral metagenome TaxID=1070528 RepID=A0A6C0ERJ7_9ZZZZ